MADDSQLAIPNQSDTVSSISTSNVPSSWFYIYGALAIIHMMLILVALLNGKSTDNTMWALYSTGALLILIGIQVCYLERSGTWGGGSHDMRWTYTITFMNSILLCVSLLYAQSLDDYIYNNVIDTTIQMIEIILIIVMFISVYMCAID